MFGLKAPLYYLPGKLIAIVCDVEIFMCLCFNVSACKSILYLHGGVSSVYMCVCVCVCVL